MKKYNLIIKDFKWFLLKENLLVNSLYYFWYLTIGVKDEPRNNPFSSKPILTKSEVKSSEVYMNPQTFFYVKGFTSGSTNAPLKVFRSVFNVVFEEYIIKSFLFKVGISLSPRIAVIRGDQIKSSDDLSTPFWKKMPFTRRLIFSSFHLSNQTIPEYLTALEDFKPEVIMAFPSSIIALAKVALQIGWQPNWEVKAVLTSSESFPKEEQARVKQVFPKVFDHYGQAERVAAFQQCAFGNYHVREDYSLVEFVEDSYGLKIIGTADKNRAMPLIRYDTGDYVEGLGIKPCLCGMKSRYVNRILGRDDDSIILPDGRVVSRLSAVFWNIPNLIECQMIQDREDHVSIKYVAEKGAKIEELEKKIELELRARIGKDILLDFEKLIKIERPKSGKFKSVINSVIQK
jgi:phenylacetate-CoA ligase